MKHVESSVKVYFTTEYGRFGFLKGNRELNDLKIKRIIQDIQDGFDILKYAPIIVNEDMRIIDGQHRFVVAQQLKTNVYYVVSREIDLIGVTKINSRASNWKAVDFLNSFVDLGKASYLKLYKFLRENPKVSLPTAFKFMHSGNSHSQEATTAFKDGALRDTHFEQLQKITSLLKDFEPYMDNPYSRHMYSVMSQLSSNGIYDHKVMLTKLEESGRRIEDLRSIKTVMTEMESIINHRMKNRVLIH